MRSDQRSPGADTRIRNREGFVDAHGRFHAPARPSKAVRIGLAVVGIFCGYSMLIGLNALDGARGIERAWVGGAVLSGLLLVVASVCVLLAQPASRRLATWLLGASLLLSILCPAITLGNEGMAVMRVFPFGDHYWSVLTFPGVVPLLVVTQLDVVIRWIRREQRAEGYTAEMAAGS